MASTNEPETVQAFRVWLVENGGNVHPDVTFRKVPSGYSVVARNDIPSDTTVVSCPFSLAVTPEYSRNALSMTLKTLQSNDVIRDWSERQLICSYLCMHWILGRERAHPVLFESPLLHLLVPVADDVLRLISHHCYGGSCPPAFQHWPYLDTLPSPDKLRTPLHFIASELETFKGSNLYGATTDRQRDWQTEWQQCRDALTTANGAWGNEYTWDRYLTAATYLSSRAFPSTLLSTTPSLTSTPTSHPVLLPGVDSLNHARGQPVSWVVSSASPALSESTISLVLHKPTSRGSELFNNYGPKPNAELILGYGFALPHNPDDTIVLKLGGNTGSGGKWEIGRNARGAEPVWEAVLRAVCAGDDEEEEEVEADAEDMMYAAETLASMAQVLLDRLPKERQKDMREEVAVMLEYYLEGQREILQSLIKFAQEKGKHAEELASVQGVDDRDEEEDLGS